ncbi:hypothetical protein MAR_013616 [Mya arenaria]|uniref:Uncharacterized protein n=1 Tax=Mya arenaria TaxID=6604 RepID=A0ABY7G3L6_MYAAR|nr:hypothetical protein MAR_013616 [Mya arenaria]
MQPTCVCHVMNCKVSLGSPLLHLKTSTDYGLRRTNLHAVLQLTEF